MYRLRVFLLALMPLVLAGCGGGGGGGSVGGNGLVSSSGSIIITHPDGIIMTGSTEEFTAQINGNGTAVNWSIAEAGGGSIEKTGNLTAQYTAPTSAGTYHISATSLDGAISAESSIRVVTAPPAPPGP